MIGRLSERCVLWIWKGFEHQINSTIFSQAKEKPKKITFNPIIIHPPKYHSKNHKKLWGRPL